MIPCISSNSFAFIRISRSFRWKFNNSGESLDVGKERHHRNGSTSILQYTPVTDQVSYSIPLFVSISHFFMSVINNILGL